MASTMQVVPTLRKVETSARLASPTMTWRRRYLSESQWGSSRVLTRGRLSVVSRPTSSSKKSARWVSWKGTSAERDPGRLRAHLARAGVDLAGHEVGHDVVDDPPEGHRPVHEVVLVGAVGVALAVGVVLVDRDRLARGQDVARVLDGLGQDALAGLVEAHQLQGVGALGRGVLGVGVVDVVAGPVGEHGVDQVGLHLGRRRAFPGEAAGVAAGRLVLEVPRHLALEAGDVGVDQQGGGGDGVGFPAPQDDPVLGLDPADLANSHRGTLSPYQARSGTDRPDRTARDTGRCQRARWPGHRWLPCPRT